MLLVCCVWQIGGSQSYYCYFGQVGLVGIRYGTLPMPLRYRSLSMHSGEHLRSLQQNHRIMLSVPLLFFPEHNDKRSASTSEVTPGV